MLYTLNVLYALYVSIKSMSQNKNTKNPASVVAVTLASIALQFKYKGLVVTQRRLRSVRISSNREMRTGQHILT